MSLKPQARVGIINDIFSHKGEKIDDLFELKKLRDAISALERNDPIQGTAARADYYSYTNQPDYALTIINKAIKKFGNNLFFSRSKTNAAEYIGKWDVIKETYEQLLISEKVDLTDETIKRYIELSDLYIDNTGKFMEILEVYKVEDSEHFYSNIESRAQNILNKDISLSTYRKTIKIALSVIIEKYNVPMNLRFNDVNLQFIISSAHWSNKDTMNITNAISDAIMADDDLDFQVEADDIEVFCINFPVEQVPEDFSYYEDDSDLDSEFLHLIQSRMQANTSPEIDGEFLHV